MAMMLGALGILYYSKAHGLWVPFAMASGFFCVCAFFATQLLGPLYKGWMAFGAVFAWINTRIILGAIFYVIVSPVAIGIRLLGKDLLDEKIDRNRASYWKRRTKRNIPESMERQF
jgi:hypothetical protein